MQNRLLFAFLAVALGPTAQASRLTALHSFTGPDGNYPNASLIRDPAGNFYGTTQSGGADQRGVVFKLDPSGNLTVLHSFTGSPDGVGPLGALLRDAAGNLYGTTGGGGASNAGTIFKIDAANNYAILYNFTGMTDGDYPEGALVRDSSGNLYGAAAGGGAFSQGVLFKLHSNGRLTVLHTFTGGHDGAQPFSSIIADPAGNLYGTTYQGGNKGCHQHMGCGVVFRYDTAGHFSVIHKFTGKVDGNKPVGNIALDAAGNLYGASTEGGLCGVCGVVFKIDPTGNFTILYSFHTHGGGHYPYGGVSLDTSGNLYGTARLGGTYNCGLVYKIDPAGNYMVLHRFNSTDGSYPHSPPIPVGHRLYGTTSEGGSVHDGVIYRIP